MNKAKFYYDIRIDAFDQYKAVVWKEVDNIKSYVTSKTYSKYGYACAWASDKCKELRKT